MIRRALFGVLFCGLAAPAAAQILPSCPPCPPRPLATIEFFQESGVERWEVALKGGPWNDERLYVRIAGSGCTTMGEMYKGMITLLYEDMTFRTVHGKTCTVTAIER
ncbi:MAG TPA: hypothetical protein VMD08_04325 [Candidatus Baltobacteraceae bacterium]|nr:hypothetical protein [Candidatus Baltobacteraceae bacterium]